MAGWTAGRFVRGKLQREWFVTEMLLGEDRGTWTRQQSGQCLPQAKFQSRKIQPYPSELQKGSSMSNFGRRVSVSPSPAKDHLRQTYLPDPPVFSLLGKATTEEEDSQPITGVRGRWPKDFSVDLAGLALERNKGRRGKEEKGFCAVFSL